MKVKICGITNQEIAELCEQNNCDFVGAIFYEKSCRNLDLKNAKSIFKNLKITKKVAVVVDPVEDFVKSVIDQFNPDLIQFHGQESIADLELFKKNYPKTPIIKAISIASKNQLENIKIFEPIIDYFLFDAVEPGSGNVFDWHILNHLNISKPWFLAGGISLANIEQAIKITNAKLIDISSSLEKTRGVKDKNLVLDFLNKINNLKQKCC